MKPTKSTISKAAKLAELIADRPVWYYFCENHENELDSLCGKIEEMNGRPVLDNYGSKENRDTMIEMLGLREWSTKEDILRALAEVL